MSSVLVVIVLLGMWAFVLVPLVRQRNVKADEARSVARFSSALRVLSRGHTLGSSSASSSGWGQRQWVMPPREGLAAVRERRMAAAAAAPAPRVGPAAARRRRLLIGLAGAVTFTLLLVLAAGRIFIVLQLLADCAFAAGIVACRWSVAQEQAAAARTRRRRQTLALRSSLREAEAVVVAAPADVPVMTTPLHAPAPVATVPLEKLSEAPAASVAVPRQHPGVRRPAARHEAAAVAAGAGAGSAGAGSAGVGARRVPPPRPRAEPVILAEIDLDWEPAVPEPSSCVRLVDLSGRSRRTPLFEDAPADGVDVGDDAELDALVQRRLAASGW